MVINLGILKEAATNEQRTRIIETMNSARSQQTRSADKNQSHFYTLIMNLWKHTKNTMSFIIALKKIR